MASLMMHLKRVALSETARVSKSFQNGLFYAFLLASVVALGIACVLTAKANTPSPQPTPEYFQQKIAQRFAACVEVYYFKWGAFTQAMKERALVTDSWICKSTVKFPIVTPLAEELAAMKLEPLEERPEDFRLSCTVTFNENEKPVTLSFARLPLSVCINGKPFEPSWNLFLRVSEFLPYEARRGLLKSVREEWPLEGYPKIPEEQEVPGENQKQP